MQAGDQDFELDIDGASGAGSDSDRDDDHGADSKGRVERSPLHHRAVPWLTLGVVLVLAGIAAAPGPPPEQVGIIDRVAEPEQQWEADVGFDGLLENEDGVIESPEVHLAGETVLYLAPDEVTALDAADGSQRWRAGGTDLRCHPSDPVLLCADGHGGDAELVRLHLADGEVARESRPNLLAAIAIEDDIAIIHSQQELTLLDRLGPDGEPRWSQVLLSGYAWPQEMALHTSMEILGENILVAIRSGAIAASGIFDVDSGQAQDLPRGAELEDRRNPPGGHLGAGWQAIGADHSTYPIAPDGTVSEPQGPTNLLVDDDAGSPVHFVTTSRALSARSEGGEEIWAREEPDPPIPWARIGGVLITIGADGLLGLDLATGAEQWQSETWPSLQTFSDGETLVQLAPGPEDRLHIVGIDAATGVESFDVATSGGSYPRITVADDRLVLLTDAELSLWTW